MAYNTVALERILKKELGEMCMSDVKYPRWVEVKQYLSLKVTF